MLRLRHRAHRGNAEPADQEYPRSDPQNARRALFVGSWRTLGHLRCNGRRSGSNAPSDALLSRCRWHVGVRSSHAGGTSELLRNKPTTRCHALFLEVAPRPELEPGTCGFTLRVTEPLFRRQIIALRVPPRVQRRVDRTSYVPLTVRNQYPLVAPSPARGSAARSASRRPPRCSYFSMDCSCVSPIGPTHPQSLQTMA